MEWTKYSIRYAYSYAPYRFKFCKVTSRSIAFLEHYRDTAKAAMEKLMKNVSIELATLRIIGIVFLTMIMGRKSAPAKRSFIPKSSYIKSRL